VPPSQLQRLGGPGCLDLAEVLQPLDHLLPQRDPEIHIAPQLSSLTPQARDPGAEPGLGPESERPPTGSTGSGLADPEEPRRDGDVSLG